MRAGAHTIMKNCNGKYEKLRGSIKIRSPAHLAAAVIAELAAANGQGAIAYRAQVMPQATIALPMIAPMTGATKSRKMEDSVIIKLSDTRFHGYVRMGVCSNPAGCILMIAPRDFVPSSSS